ncbi:MAG TPA: hypothetical protein EYP23_03105 [Thermoplasmata archaeon]|nr:hypothetical protein [Thermoplasmata archaeon]
MIFEKSVEETKKDIVISIHVSPNKKRCIFPAGYNEWRESKSIEIHVKGATYHNEANRELVSSLSSFFGFFVIPKGNIVILSGKTSQEKNGGDRLCSKKEALERLRGAFNEL